MFNLFPLGFDILKPGDRVISESPVDGKKWLIVKELRWHPHGPKGLFRVDEAELMGIMANGEYNGAHYFMPLGSDLANSIYAVFRDGKLFVKYR